MEYLKNILEFNKDTPALVFTFTSSLLTIVGLLAIFISLNAQHLLQKVREYYWQMKNLRASFDLGTREPSSYDQAAQEFYRAYTIYKSLFQKDHFTSSILRVTKCSVIGVLVIWWVTLGGLWLYPGVNTYSSGDFGWIIVAALIVTGLMIWFLVYLWNLDDIPKMSGLLPANKLTDMKENNFFLPIACTLLGITYYLRKPYVTIPYVIDEKTGEKELVFKNIEVAVKALCLDLKDDKGKIHGNYVDLVHSDPKQWGTQLLLTEDNIKFFRSGTAWFDLTDCLPSEWGVFSVENFEFTLTLTSKESEIKVCYPKISVNDVLRIAKRTEIELQYSAE